jgi:hypothetical protein
MQVSQSSWTSDGTSVVSKSRTLTRQQLYCDVTVSNHSVHAHSVRVSYTETSDQSTSLVYVVFNSICHNCEVLNNMDVNCTRKVWLIVNDLIWIG